MTWVLVLHLYGGMLAEGQATVTDEYAALKLCNDAVYSVISGHNGEWDGGCYLERD